VRSEYHDPAADPWRIVIVPVLKEINRAELARRCGVTERHIARLRNLKELPSPELRGRLTRIAGDYARTLLRHDAPADDLAACAAYLVQASASEQSALD